LTQEGKQPGEQINACGHHSGRVEQGAHWCGALHGVGQPCHERKLCALTNDAAEDKESRQREKAGGHAGRHLWVVHLQDLQVSYVKQHEQKADEKRDVTQTGHDEGLLSRLGSAKLFVPEADEQIRRKPNQLPEDIKLKHSRGDAQGHHCPCKEGLERIIPGETGIACHVAEGVDLNKKTDDRHQRKHKQAHRIKQKPEGNVDIPCDEPSGSIMGRSGRVPMSNQKE
jgi:hypothetical protein